MANIPEKEELAIQTWYSSVMRALAFLSARECWSYPYEIKHLIACEIFLFHTPVL